MTCDKQSGYTCQNNTVSKKATKEISYCNYFSSSSNCKAILLKKNSTTFYYLCETWGNCINNRGIHFPKICPINV